MYIELNAKADERLIGISSQEELKILARLAGENRLAQAKTLGLQPPNGIDLKTYVLYNWDIAVPELYQKSEIFRRYILQSGHDIYQDTTLHMDTLSIQATRTHVNGVKQGDASSPTVASDYILNLVSPDLGDKPIKLEMNQYRLEDWLKFIDKLQAFYSEETASSQFRTEVTLTDLYFNKPPLPVGQNLDDVQHGEPSTLVRHEASFDINTLGWVLVRAREKDREALFQDEFKPSAVVGYGGYFVQADGSMKRQPTFFNYAQDPTPSAIVRQR